MDGKSLLGSKTFWVNFVTFLAALGALLLNQSWVTANPQAVAAIGAVVAALNIVLRLLSGQPITSLIAKK